MFALTSCTGIWKKIIVHGTGDNVPDGAIVYAHYSVHLQSSDSSRLLLNTSFFKENSLGPVRIDLRVEETMPGFVLAVLSMKKGERSYFYLDAQHGFGLAGRPPRIPPNSPLTMNIQLVNFFENNALVPAAVSLAANLFEESDNIFFAIERDLTQVYSLLTWDVQNDTQKANHRDSELLPLFASLCSYFNDPRIRMPHEVCIFACASMEISAEKTKANKVLIINWLRAQISINVFLQGRIGLVVGLSANMSSLTSELKHIVVQVEENVDKYIIYGTYLKKAVGYEPKISHSKRIKLKELGNGFLPYVNKLMMKFRTTTVVPDTMK